MNSWFRLMNSLWMSTWSLGLFVLGCGQKTNSIGQAPAATLASCGTAPSAFDTDPCPQSLCGNGKIDVCRHDGWSSEACDGTDLNSQSCTSRGYFGGTLTCTPSCTLNTAGCVSCGSDARILACVHRPTSVPPDGLALAATSGEIGVAWIEAASNNPSPRLHFSRFRPDFTLLSDTGCFGPADAVGVQLASLGLGWVVGTLSGNSQDASMVLAMFDSHGMSTGLRTFDIGSSYAWSSNSFRLTNGRAGSVLVTWLQEGGNPANGTLNAMLVGPDGGTIWNDMGIVDRVWQWWSVAAIDDRFMLAADVQPSSTGAIQLLRLGFDGSVSVGTKFGSGCNGCGGLLNIAWSGGSDLRLWYQSAVKDPNSGLTDNGSLMQRVARDTSLIGGPLTVDPAESGGMQLFAVGDDTVFLEDPTPSGGADALDLARLSSSGLAVWPEVEVLRASGNPGSGLAQQNGDAIVAWAENGRSNLSFARVRIAP